MVEEFHRKFDQPWPDKPDLGNEDTNALRLALILEELKELGDALGYKLVYDGERGGVGFVDNGQSGVDKVGAFDALCDIQYVLDGTFGSLGYAAWKDAGLAEVHRSNMSKVWSDGSVRKHPNGKVMKPPSFTPPDLKGVLEPCTCGCPVADCEYCEQECSP